MNYYNGEKIQYILSFPEYDYINLNILFKEEANRKVKISSDIKIISAITNSNSLFMKQCEFNDFDIIKSTNKEILNELLKIKEEYVLIVKNQDAMIVNDLTEEFIDKFDSLNLPFVFASSVLRIPFNNLEGSKELFKNQKNKFVNAMLMFGKKEYIINFYNSIIDNEDIEDDLLHEQIKIRKTLMIPNDCISYIDYNNLLFSTILKRKISIIEKDNKIIVEENNFDTSIEDAIF